MRGSPAACQPRAKPDVSPCPPLLHARMAQNLLIRDYVVVSAFDAAHM